MIELKSDQKNVSLIGFFTLLSVKNGMNKNFLHLAQ